MTCKKKKTKTGESTRRQLTSASHERQSFVFKDQSWASQLCLEICNQKTRKPKRKKKIEISCKQAIISKKKKKLTDVNNKPNLVLGGLGGFN